MRREREKSRQLVTLQQAVEQRPWLTERWLRRLVYERRVPFHKVGNRLVFDLADLDALAEQGRVERADEIIPDGSVSRRWRRR
jgi:hypothetical protein